MSNKKPSVLIVDDEQVVCDLLHDELSERGYLCMIVLNANEAFTKLRTHHFDAVLLDIRLPGISGMELLRKMRSRHHHTAFIMITAINNIDTAVEAMRLGALDYVVKPFDIDRVSSGINTALENIKHSLVKKDSQTAEEPLSPMDAIARGIEAKLDLLDGHSMVVIQKTIDVARQLGIAEAEIQRWTVARTRFECLKKSKINSLLNKLERNPLTQSIIGMTDVYLYTLKSGEIQN